MTQIPNFLIDVQNPFQKAIEGFQIGTQLGQQRQQSERVRQQQKRAVEMQQDLARLSKSENISSRDIATLGVKYPEISENLRKNFELLNADQQRGKLTQMSQVFSALETGNVDVAKNLLETQKQAALNSGVDDEARSADIILKQIDMDPDVAKFSTRLALSTILGPDKFAENLKKLNEATAVSEKLDLTRLNESLKASKSNFEAEDKIRKEYNPIKKKFNEVNVANQKLVQSLRQQTAVGDLAGIFSFMKVLDPGSTVREGEFATAQNSAGVPSRIRSQYNKILSGERLTPVQRSDFLKTTENLFKTEVDSFLTDLKRLEKVVHNRGLNSENVFGDEFSSDRFFKSVKEAENANLPVGTIVFIGGRRAVVE